MDVNQKSAMKVFVVVNRSGKNLFISAQDEQMAREIAEGRRFGRPKGSLLIEELRLPTEEEIGRLENNADYMMYAHITKKPSTPGSKRTRFIHVRSYLEVLKRNRVGVLATGKTWIAVFSFEDESGLISSMANTASQENG